MSLLNTTTPAAAPTPALTPTPVGQTTSDPAQMLANQQATVANSGGTLKIVNGQVVSANSTLAGLSTVTPSKSTDPSSSATVVQGLNGQTAINGTTTAPVTTPKVTQGDFYNALNSYTGTTLDSGIIAQGVASGKTEEEATQEMNTKVLANQAANQLSLQHQQDLAAQQASDLADTAENDAELAAAKAQVDQQMTTLGQAQTNKAADAGYGVSAVGTNQSGAAAYVAGVKSASYTQLQNLANQKQAAINSGNTKAIASINDSYNKVVADLQSKLSSDMTQQSQNAQTLAANEKSRQDTLDANTQNRATSQYNTSLSNLTSASPLNGLFDSSGQPTAGAITDPAFTNSSTYQQGTAAGLSPQAILADAQNAIKTSKAATAQKNTDARLESLQESVLRTQLAQGKANLVQTTETAVSNVESSLSKAGISPDSGDGLGLMMKASVGGNKIDTTSQNKIESLISLQGKVPDIVSSLNDLNQGSIVSNILGGSTPWDTKVQLYEGQVLQTLTPLARSIYQESGRISSTDEARVLKSMGTKMETSQVRNQLMAGVLTSIRDSVQSQFYTMSHSAIDVSAFSTKATQLVNELNTQIDILKPITSTDSSGNPTSGGDTGSTIPTTPSWMSGAQSYFSSSVGPVNQ